MIDRVIQMKQKYGKNILLYLIGVGFMPLGVVMTIKSHMGAGGYDALNFALADALECKTSYAIYITSMIVVLIAAAIRRGWPRITTFVTSFFLGISTDIWNELLRKLDGTTLGRSILLLALGIVIVGITVASYMLSKLPTNPTDDMLVALKEKKVPIFISKITLDVTCVVIAFFLGGEIGIGTLIITFGLGPVIDFFYKIISKI